MHRSLERQKKKLEKGKQSESGERQQRNKKKKLSVAIARDLGGPLDASDLQGEKGCDITEMPQMQITH